MNPYLLFPLLTPSILLLIAGFLAKEMIVTRLRKSVQSEFDGKLAKLRADLDERGARFKAELQARQTEMETLRSGALSSLASRQVALDERKLEAVDQLWSAVTALAFFKPAARIMQVVNYETAAKETAKNEDARKVFKLFSVAPDKYQTKWEEAAKAQPYITPMAWALYTTYAAIAGLGVLQLYLLSTGLADRKFVDTASVKKLIDATLPHQSKGLEDFGSTFAYMLLDELEEKLLLELRNSFSNTESSKESLKQASEIMKEADNLKFSVEKETRLQN